MSEDRRYQSWKKRSKQFYKSRDYYAEGRREIDLNSAIKFCESCRRESGFAPNPHFSKIDLESTFAGIAIAKLLGKEREWKINNIEGKLVEKKGWWNIEIEDQSFIADTQNIYRFTLLSQMNGHLTNGLKKDISKILFKCYDSRIKAFLRKPKARYTLRHVYEAVIGLVTCDETPPSTVLEYIDKCQHNSGGYCDQLFRKPDIQSTYNAVAVQLLIGKSLNNDKEKILNYLQGCWAGDGFRVAKNHHPGVWDNYCACLSLRMLLSDIEKYTISLENYLAGCQAPNGGMRSSVHEGKGTILRTYAVLTTIAEFSKFNGILNCVYPLTGIPKNSSLFNTKTRKKK